MMKIHCAESGYWIEIDGQMSEAHRYGYACIIKGPSGTLYGTQLEEEPEPGKKAQLYRLTPVDSLTESNLEDGDAEYQELADPDEEDEDEEEDGDGDEVEVTDDADADADDDADDDDLTSKDADVV